MSSSQAVPVLPKRGAHQEGVQRVHPRLAQRIQLSGQPAQREGGRRPLGQVVEQQIPRGRGARPQRHNRGVFAGSGICTRKE